MPKQIITIEIQGVAQPLEQLCGYAPQISQANEESLCRFTDPDNPDYFNLSLEPGPQYGQLKLIFMPFEIDKEKQKNTPQDMALIVCYSQVFGSPNDMEEALQSLQDNSGITPSRALASKFSTKSDELAQNREESDKKIAKAFQQYLKNGYEFEISDGLAYAAMNALRALMLQHRNERSSKNIVSLSAYRWVL